MKYACIQRYYDNGRVTANVEEVPYETEDSYKEYSKFDQYIDVFHSKEEAEQCKENALRA